MSTTSRIGIIDIGSNSIRLVIIEHHEQGAHRVLGEWKESARLSERIDEGGILHEEDVEAIVPMLNRFRSICDTNGVTRIRAAATAAIRNAANSASIVHMLRLQTGLSIEVLSGEEEGRFGFYGVINTIAVNDGFIVDIGGGSTEVTLFENRRLLHSVSFPFGAVNTCRQYTASGDVMEEQIRAIRSMVEKAASADEWITSNPGLPLFGLGGTVRTLGKLDQKRRKYSFNQAHNYRIPVESIDEMARWLPSQPYEKRKKIEGLSKDRADIIIPGLIILQTLFGLLHAKDYIVSGAGLRDGLFYEMIRPQQPVVEDVLENSVNNQLALHSFIPPKHAAQVDRLTAKLFDALQPQHGLGDSAKRLLSVAARLYRLGAAVQYYQYTRHTFYMLAYTRIDGLSHRDALLCALIASYKSKSRTHQMLLPFKDIVPESDEMAIAKLGTLLQVAVALDKSETQVVQQVHASADGKSIRLKLICREFPLLELKEAAAADKEFQKIWNAKLELEVTSGASSTD